MFNVAFYLRPFLLPLSTQYSPLPPPEDSHVAPTAPRFSRRPHVLGDSDLSGRLCPAAPGGDEVLPVSRHSGGADGQSGGPAAAGGRGAAGDDRGPVRPGGGAGADVSHRPVLSPPPGRPPEADGVRG